MFFYVLPMKSLLQYTLHSRLRNKTQQGDTEDTPFLLLGRDLLGSAHLTSTGAISLRAKKNPNMVVRIRRNPPPGGAPARQNKFELQGFGCYVWPLCRYICQRLIGSGAIKYHEDGTSQPWLEHSQRHIYIYVESTADIKAGKIE